MRFFFPNRPVASGYVKLEIQNNGIAGNYEILTEKYFKSMSSIREEIESKLGDLRMADISMNVLDFDRKFRDTILRITYPGEPVLFKASLGGLDVPSPFDQALFFGYVDSESIEEDEKSNVIKFSASSPIRRLGSVSIQQLWDWLRARGLERRKDYEWVGGQLYNGKFVSLKDVLAGMASLVGLADVEIESTWKFLDWRSHYAVSVDRLWIQTEEGIADPYGVRRGMFDADLQRSPMSFFRFDNCLSLMKYFQLSFFSFAYVRYSPVTDMPVLKFKQRGSTANSFATDGRLLESKVHYSLIAGVKVANEYGRDPGDGYADYRRTIRGSYNERTGMTLALPWKTAEFPTSFTELNGYSYIYGSIDQVQDRVEIQMMRRVVANGWPMYGVNYPQLHHALAEAYYTSQGGRKQHYTRTYHGLTATRDEVSSIDNIRVMESETFVRQGTVVSTEVTFTDIDAFKNVVTITGIER